MSKRLVFSFFAILLSVCAPAQETQTDYNFLRLPVSAHVAALGGDNVTITDDDASLLFSNPALLMGVSARSLNLDFMTYMSGTKLGSAAYALAVGKRGMLAFDGQFIDYGQLRETTADNVETGTFAVRDMALGATFAYNLTNRLSGGVTGKVVHSHIGSYNSLAMGVDLGLNYYNDDSGLSLSAVARNLGGQLKAYDDDYEAMPFDLQVGVSQRLGNAPLRPSVVLKDLTDWKTYKSLVNHLVVGLDVFIGESIYVAAGYNFRRAKDMTLVDEKSHGAGWSFGGGLQLERFKLQVAYARYHVSTASLLASVSYAF